MEIFSKFTRKQRCCIITQKSNAIFGAENVDFTVTNKWKNFPIQHKKSTNFEFEEKNSLEKPHTRANQNNDWKLDRFSLIWKEKKKWSINWSVIIILMVVWANKPPPLPGVSRWSQKIFFKYVSRTETHTPAAK